MPSCTATKVAKAKTACFGSKLHPISNIRELKRGVVYSHSIKFALAIEVGSMKRMRMLFDCLVGDNLPVGTEGYKEKYLLGAGDVSNHFVVAPLLAR